MASLKIKYPTLITSILSSHHNQFVALRQDIINSISAYNNLSASDKLRIPFRGKSKNKVIKHIHYDLCNIGQVPSIIICVEEYRDGFDDLYLQQIHSQQVSINPADRLGSSKNYALLYPIIEPTGTDWHNQWLVVIYDTPNKDDSDIINTIKYTVNKVFNLPFKFALPVTYQGDRTIPKVEVTYVSIENADNMHMVLRSKIVSSTTKAINRVQYENVTTDEIQTIINDRVGMMEGIKRKLKLFKDTNNKSSTETITQEMDSDGNIQSTYISKYSYSQDIQNEELSDINTIQTMVRNFREVITNYLSNGTV